VAVRRMMKRAVIEAVEVDIEKVLQKDKAHRIREIRDFVLLPDSIEGNFSIFRRRYVPHP
jgi:hypothetical protein